MSSGPPKSSSTKLGRFQMPRVGDTLEGRYEINQVLATGGMGVILKATHLRMGREVAVKILHPHIAQEADVVARFEREVRLAQLLNHPNTIRLYDFGEAENGLVYVVMELLDGADLKEIIAEEGTMPVGRAVDLTMQVLDGLGEAHEQDFVHRDLKPSNIFVIKDRRGADEVKILDFGIAKSLEEGDGDLTATGSICGTAAYVAPEYLHDPTPQKSADVYAVGLILLEMLTGRRAFLGTTTAQTLMMQLQREIQVPRQLAATPLGEVIARSVSKDPAGRYQTADQMFQALEAVVDQLPADLQLQSGQIGELLRPPSGTFSGTGQPSSDSGYPQDSSASLPQATATPLSGEHSSPDMGPMDGEPTLVTPFPSPMESSQEIPLRAPDYVSQQAGGQESTQQKTSGKNNTFLWAIGAAVVVLGVVAAGFVLTGDTKGDGAEPAASIGSSDAPPEPAGPKLAGPNLAGPNLAGPNLAGPNLAGEHRNTPPTAEPSAIGAADEADETEPIEFHIESLPAAALVFDGDDEIGQTPLSHTIERDALPRTLRLEKDGFQEATIDLSAESDNNQQVMLLDEPEAEPEPRVEKPARTQPARRQPAPAKPTPAGRSTKSSGQEDKPKEGEENVDEFLDEYL